jgi:hypothetical protein
VIGTEVAMRKRTLVVLAALAVVLTACQFGSPEPAVRSAPDGSPHRTVLMFGDSLMGQHDAVLPAVLKDHGLDLTIVDAHVNASGLIGPVGTADSALDWVQQKVAEHPEADPIVVEWAGACGVCGTTVGEAEYPTIGDSGAGFYDMWMSHAFEIIDWLHSQGKTVVWVVSPPFGLDSTLVPVRVEAAKWLSIFDTYLIGPHAGSPSIDWFTALSDTNRQYATTLWYDNTSNTVRTSDLTHFTSEGATRAAKWTVSVLIDVLASMPPPPPSSASVPTGLVEAGDPVRLDVGPGL